MKEKNGMAVKININSIFQFILVSQYKRSCLFLVKPLTATNVLIPFGNFKNLILLFKSLTKSLFNTYLKLYVMFPSLFTKHLNDFNNAFSVFMAALV